MIDPPVWTETELETERQTAIVRFRKERIAEPLKKYLDVLDKSRPIFAELLEWLFATPDPGSVSDDVILRILTSKAHLEAFRYVAAPPISEDDLKTLAEVSSLSAKGLRTDTTRARAVFNTVIQALDLRRFVWTGARLPEASERAAAVLASTALLASRRTETARRFDAKAAQEASVRAALVAIGFSEDKPRDIGTLSAAPARGHFCGESLLGTRKADIVARLLDDRILAIECKVSNSALNSIKRLNNDAAAKAVEWLRQFGTRNVVPCAMLSGVYGLANLLSAQTSNLTLFWAHDLETFKDWVKRTRA